MQVPACYVKFTFCLTQLDIFSPDLVLILFNLIQFTLIQMGVLDLCSTIAVYSIIRSLLFININF
jgi:hypothetical protein